MRHLAGGGCPFLELLFSAKTWRTLVAGDEQQYRSHGKSS